MLKPVVPPVFTDGMLAIWVPPKAKKRKEEVPTNSAMTATVSVGFVCRLVGGDLWGIRDSQDI